MALAYSNFLSPPSISSWRNLIMMHNKISNFVRLTADSPLVSFQLLNQMIVFFYENNFEYLKQLKLADDELFEKIKEN